MAVAEDLGVAVLTLRVNSQAAQQQIEAFKTQLTRVLGDVGQINFSGVEQSARASGERAGKALAAGVTQATKGLRFDSIEEALNFSGALDGTIRDLRTYKAALEALRDATNTATPGFASLNEAIDLTSASLKQFQSASGQKIGQSLIEAVSRLNGELQEQQTQLKQSAASEKEWAAALKEIESAQRSAAEATRATNKELRSQVDAALNAAKAIAGIAAKGASEAIKVPIFGLPKGTENVIDKARAQIERLQKQSETASGKVARLSEGVFALSTAGAAAKGIVDVLGGVGGTAEAAAKALVEVATRLNTLPGALKGLGGLGDLFTAGSQSINQFAAGILSTQGGLSGLTAPLQSVTELLTALGPEAAAVGGALAFSFAGFQDLIARSFKPGIDGAREALKGMTNDTQQLLEALSRAAEASTRLASARDLKLGQQDAARRAGSAPVGTKENLDATQELVTLNKLLSQELQRQADLEDQLARLAQIRLQREQQKADAITPALPPEQKLLPAYEERGLKQLDDSVRKGESFRAISEAIGSNWERGARFIEKSAQELQRLVDIGLRQRTNLIAPSAPAASLPNPSQYGSPIGPAESPIAVAQRREAQLLDDLAVVTARRLAIEESILQLQQATKAAYARQERQARAIGEFNSSPIDGRLRDGTLINGSPAFLRDQQKRLSDARSSALIGGVFPLLFGQGLGASVGGGLGGFAGGLQGGQLGFGLSLLGTAVGAQFDTATKNVALLGSALDNPIAKFGELTQAGLLSSKGLEKQVQALIDTGREAEAAALVQKDLANSYGDLSSAKELANSTDKLKRAWGQLGVSIAALTAGPIANLLNKINSALGQGNSGTSVGLLPFNAKVNAIGSEYGSSSALSIKRRAAELDAKGSLQNFFPELVNTLSFGLIGKSSEARRSDNRAQALREAEASGLVTKQAREANAELVKAQTIREKLIEVTTRQVQAEAQGNVVASAGLKFDEIKLKLREQLSALQTQGKLFTQYGANSYELSPEAQKAQEDATAQRKQQAIAAAAAAEQSERELRNIRQLVGLQGERLTIVQQQQRVDEAQRQFAQADQAFRDKFGNAPKSAVPKEDQQEWQALYDRRLALEKQLIATRLSAYDQIDVAEQAIEQKRKRTEQSIKVASLGNSITDTGRGALMQAADFEIQIKAVQRLRDLATGNPGNFQLAEQAKDAGLSLVDAGLNLRNSLQQAAQTAAASVQSITRSIEDARTAFAAVRGSAGGLNQFLQPQQAQERQAAANQELYATANALAQKLGVVATFTGTLVERNRQMVDFIQAARAEIRAPEDIAVQQQSLTQALGDLGAINSALSSVSGGLKDAIGPLTTEIGNLVGKDWSVNVTVTKDGGVIKGPLAYNPG